MQATVYFSWDESDKVVHDDIETVVPATNEFPQWSLFLNDKQTVIFYSAKNTTAVKLHDPEGQVGEKTGTVQTS